jgi:site-specific DNA-methyltransferase (adenine-specific)
MPKIHPTQKPVNLLEKLIEIFTDEWEVVIDPCAWSWTTLLRATNLRRKAFWFEIKKEFVKKAQEELFTKKIEPTLF